MSQVKIMNGKDTTKKEITLRKKEKTLTHNKQSYFSRPVKKAI